PRPTGGRRSTERGEPPCAVDRTTELNLFSLRGRGQPGTAERGFFMSPPKPLPARPSLEHLKDQADDVRRAFARGDAEARARIHAVEPVRSAMSTTHPVLSAAHALLVIAREY